MANLTTMMEESLEACTQQLERQRLDLKQEVRLLLSNLLLTKNVILLI